MKTILALCLFMTACTKPMATVPPAVALPAPPTPPSHDGVILPPAGEDAYSKPTPTKGWLWNDFVAAHLTPTILHSNISALCKKANTVNRVKFWQALVQATAKFESSYDPKSDMTEKFPDSHGNRQVSSGLMQLSLDDHAHGGEFCSKLVSTAAIHDPEINLGCSLQIMEHLIKGHPGAAISPRPVLGAYWSTIRDHKIDALLLQLVPECK